MLNNASLKWTLRSSMRQGSQLWPRPTPSRQRQVACREGKAVWIEVCRDQGTVSRVGLEGSRAELARHVETTWRRALEGGPSTSSRSPERGRSWTSKDERELVVTMIWGSKVEQIFTFLNKERTSQIQKTRRGEVQGQIRGFTFPGYFRSGSLMSVEKNRNS